MTKPQTLLIAAALTTVAFNAQAVDFVKMDNTSSLNQAASWSNNAVPTNSDTMVITNNFTTNRTAALGTNISVNNIIYSGNFQFQISATTGSALTVGSGGISKTTVSNLIIASALNLGANQTWNIDSGSMQVNGAFSDGGNTLQINGVGTLDLRGSNTFGSNVTIDTPVSINSAGIKVTFGGNNTFNSLSVPNGTASGATIGNFGVASSFGDGGTSTAITLGSSGANGILEYTGNSVSVNRTFARDARSAASGINVTTAGQTLTVSGGMGSGTQSNAVGNGWAFGGAGNLVLNGVISNATGAGSFGTTVTKSGTGTLTLGAATNVYTGATTVSDGVLLVNGQLNSSSTLGVAAAGTVGGTGVINGVATIDGAVAPGSGGIGTLTVSNNVTWNDSVNDWKFELGAAGASMLSPGTSDLLAITGDFTKGTGSSFTFDFLGTGAQGWYKLADWSGSTTFAGTDFAGVNLGSGLSVGGFTVDGGTSALYLEVVPEPSTVALLALSGVALASHVIRRRRR